MVMQGGSEKVNVKGAIKEGVQGGKNRLRKKIVMIIRKVTRKCVSTGVIRPAEINGLEPNIVRKAIFPDIQGQFAKVLRPSPAFMINVADS